MKNTRLILGIIFALFVIGFTIFNFNNTSREDEIRYSKLIKEYPILHIKDSIDIQVSNIYKDIEHYDNNPYEINITTQNNEKYTIYTPHKSFDNPKIILQDIVKVGTKMQKQSGKDTLEVITDNKKYRFIIEGSF